MEHEGMNQAEPEQVKTPEYVITSRAEAEKIVLEEPEARRSIEAVIAQIEEHQ